MKDIVFVIGPSNSGKSYFIKKYLPDYKVVDVFNYQSTGVTFYEDILRSYDECEVALREACNKYDKVVLEHTLVLDKRRTRYIQAVKEELGPDAKITCYYSYPDIKTYQQYDKIHLKEWQAKNPNKIERPIPKAELQRWLDMFEIPTNKSGFDKVVCIQDMD